MYRYTVKEEDLKATFSWIYTVLDFTIIAGVIGFTVTRPKTSGLPSTVLIAAVLCLYGVFAIVRVRMDALTPGLEYLLYPAKYGVIFQMISTADYYNEDLEVKLFVPFLRIKENATKRAFSLYALAIYVTEDDKENVNSTQ